MIMALTGLRALITGGSSGIGAATARMFATRGVRVAVAGRDVAALRQVTADTGGVILPGDLTEPGCPRQTVEDAADALGGLEIVVSNAGIGWAGSFASMTETEIDSLLDVNLRAAAIWPAPRYRTCRQERAGSSSWGPSPDWSASPARPGTPRPRPASGAWRTPCARNCGLPGSG